MKWFEQQTILASFFRTLYKIPGVKVDRDAFLTKQFEKSPQLAQILLDGPLRAGVPQKEVKRLAKRLVGKRTRQSTTLSFGAGLPGGFAMAATVPADTLQFLGNALRLAQEMAYLYGYRDFWQLQDEARKNDLLLLLGTMLQVKGGAAAMRLLTTRHTEIVSRKISFSEMEKAMYWPILGEIATVIIEKITKKTMASGVTKFIPLAGGFLSGGITYTALSNMGDSLLAAFEAGVGYDTEKMEADIADIKTHIATAVPHNNL